MTAQPIPFTIEHPLDLVIPMIRAAIRSSEAGEKVGHVKASDVDVMAGCQERFGNNGLTTMVIGLSVAGAAAAAGNAAARKRDVSAVINDVTGELAPPHAPPEPPPLVARDFVARLVETVLAGGASAGERLRRLLVEINQSCGPRGSLGVLIYLADFAATTVVEAPSPAAAKQLLGHIDRQLRRLRGQ